MGLESHVENGSVTLRCPGRAQDQVRLILGPRKSIARVCWGSREGDLPLPMQHLASHDIVLEAAPAHAPDRGIWLRDPDGMLLNIRAAERAEQKRPAVEINNPKESPSQAEVAEEGPDSLYQWATMPPPEDFLKNHARLQ